MDGNKNRKEIGDYWYFTNELIGSSSSGTGKVYKAHHKKTDAVVCLKVIPLIQILETKENTKLFIRQVELINEISHEHVVEFLDCEVSENNEYVYLFLEYCEGDIRKLIKEKGPLPEPEAKSILLQICKVFLDLENLSIPGDNEKMALIHRDLKPSNILFRDGMVKISDFGFAKLVDTVAKHVKIKQSQMGTSSYQCPQILEGDVYSAKCDVWSIGCVFYECLFKRPPFEGNTDVKLHENMKAGLTFPHKLSEETTDLLTKMLKMKEEERLDWRGVRTHPALKNIPN
jgi:serine/threonine protein kinase